MTSVKVNKTELTDIKRLLKEIQILHKSVKHAVYGNSDLINTQFYSINTNLEIAIGRIEHLSEGKGVLLTHDIHDNIDLSINSATPIFLNFWSTCHNLSFEHYFYKNLNPDNAPPGFLEQLDKLIQIAVERSIKVYAINNEQEINYFNVIKNYIEAQ